MKAAMSYEARFSRIKLAKVAARMERFDRRSYFEAKLRRGCPDRVPAQFIRAELIFKIIHDLIVS